MDDPLNILIVKMSAIGDVIHTLPALNAIRRHWPRTRITWLVEEAAADIVMGHAALDRVIVSRRKKWLKALFSSQGLESARQIHQFIRELRDTEYDMIIDFQTLLKSAAMVTLARGQRKIGFDRGMAHAEHSHLFYNERIAPVSMEIHALDRGLMLINRLGIPAGRVEYHLPVSTEDHQMIDRLLTEKGVDPLKPIICINPKATWTTKLWDNNKFAVVGDTLKQKYGAQIVFTGGKEDTEDAAAIISLMHHPAVSLAGLTSLKTLAALFQKADLLVTTDTGPMHLGAAVGVKVAAIFGSTAPWRTGPYGENNVVVRSAVPCSPCFKRECPTRMECMTRVSVEAVLNSIDRLMENAS